LPGRARGVGGTCLPAGRSEDQHFVLPHGPPHLIIMKMIRAMIRPEREAQVLSSLETAGFYAITKVPVLGRGQQRGIQVGAVSYDELAKLMLILGVEDADCPRAVQAIEEAAHTGHPGDGKIFIQEVRQVYTIRTGRQEL